MAETANKNVFALLQQEIESALAAFVEVQQEHLALCQANRLKNLPSWYDQRQKSFLLLKQCFAKLNKKEIPADYAGRLQKKIARILQDEEKLADMVGCQHEMIREKLKSVRKGKTVLKGYSVLRGNVSKPKFVSSRT